MEPPEDEPPLRHRRRGLYIGVRACSLATLVGLVLLALIGGTTLSQQLARGCSLGVDTAPGVARMPELGCVVASVPIVVLQVHMAPELKSEVWGRGADFRNFTLRPTAVCCAPHEAGA